jgi:hypothetical protein
MITNRTVNLIVRYSDVKIYYYNNVHGYSIAEGKIHFRNPVNNNLMHIPKDIVSIEDVYE